MYDAPITLERAREEFAAADEKLYIEVNKTGDAKQATLNAWAGARCVLLDLIEMEGAA